MAAKTPKKASKKASKNATNATKAAPSAALTALDALRLLRKGIDGQDWSLVRRAYASLAGEDATEDSGGLADTPDDALLADTRRLNKAAASRVRDRREPAEYPEATCAGCGRKERVNPALVAPQLDDRRPRYQCNDCQTGRRPR